jgi:hypothetical protein
MIPDHRLSELIEYLKELYTVPFSLSPKNNAEESIFPLITKVQNSYAQMNSQTPENNHYFNNVPIEVLKWRISFLHSIFALTIFGSVEFRNI